MKWKVTILLIIVFAIDCITGNWVRIVGNNRPETQEQWQEQVILYNTAKSWFNVVPYILIILLCKNHLKMDKWDCRIAVTCIVFTLINVSDWYINNNWRPVWFDFLAFSVIIVFFILRKLFQNGRHKAA